TMFRCVFADGSAAQYEIAAILPSGPKTISRASSPGSRSSVVCTRPLATSHRRTLPPLLSWRVLASARETNVLHHTAAAIRPSGLKHGKWYDTPSISSRRETAPLLASSRATRPAQL